MKIENRFYSAKVLSIIMSSQVTTILDITSKGLSNTYSTGKKRLFIVNFISKIKEARNERT